MSPQLVQVLQSFLGILKLQIASIVMMPEEQRAILVVIGVFNFDDWYRARADILNQGFFDLTPVEVIGDSTDDSFISPRSIFEKIKFSHEFFG